MRRAITCFLLCASMGKASAIGTGFCFEEAASRYGQDVLLLKAIARVESNFNPLAINPDSQAIGVMQIHPLHLKYLARYGITREKLFDPCTNINIGAWVLSDMQGVFGDTWRAVGGYGAGVTKNGKTERDRAVYAAKVRRALDILARGNGA